jgi:DNA-binding NarL/FixJ family response regulator
MAHYRFGKGYLYHIVETDNGEDLLKRMNNCKPDICVLDISMPRKNGYETVVEIRKSFPSVKTLILTMYNNEFAILKMLRNGANGYLLKNCHPNDLKVALKSIYTTGYYHSDFVSSRVFKSIENDKNIVLKINDRKIQFLELCCRDINYKQMAEIMNCSPRTVESYRDALFLKLNLNTRTALAMYAIQIGLVCFS